MRPRIKVTRAFRNRFVPFHCSGMQRARATYRTQTPQTTASDAGARSDAWPDPYTIHHPAGRLPTGAIPIVVQMRPSATIAFATLMKAAILAPAT